MSFELLVLLSFFHMLGLQACTAGLYFMILNSEPSALHMLKTNEEHIVYVFMTTVQKLRRK